MPKAQRYYDPNDQLRNALMPLSGDDLADRTKTYNTALNYYEGRQKKHLDMKDDEPEDNVVINVTRMAIDRTISFLFPAMPDLELDPKETEETEDEKWLREAWESNGGIALLHDIAQIGALSGHNYVRIMPPKFKGDYPRAVVLDPTTIQSFYKDDDKDFVVWHEISWSVLDGQEEISYVLDIINDEDNDRWILRQWRSSVGISGWMQDGADEIWPSRFGPIVHWKHLPNPNRFYGRSEADHLALNDALNLITSENMRINRYHSSPKTIGTGVSPQEVQQTAIDSFWAVENEDAEIFNLEMRSEQEFSQQLATFMYDSYLSESRVVLLRGEVKDFQRVTNAGVRTVFIDMLSKNTILRQLYGQAIRQISQRMGMLGLGRDDILPTVAHHDPLPTDDTEIVNTQSIERSMGVVSRQTISQKRGYTWQDELDRMRKESEEEALNPAKAMAEQQGATNGRPGNEGQASRNTKLKAQKSQE